VSARRAGSAQADRTERERGAVLLVSAVSMVALLIVTAIVVDLGYVRAQKRDAQREVDLAALAAGAELASTSGADPRAACEDALQYLGHNVSDLPEATEMPCGLLPADCDGDTERMTITDEDTADPYRIELTYPVPDEDIRDNRIAGGLRNDDGEPCERMGISLRRARDGFFSGIMGRDELYVLASAVVRRAPAESSRVPNLWLLEPFGCNVLKVSGSSGSTLSVGTDTASGLITVDSSGDGTSCNNPNDFVIDADGSSARIEAIPPDLDPPGEISLVAYAAGQTTCSEGNLNACEPGDVMAGRLDPQPIRRPTRATRSYVDHVYNCREDYPDYTGDGGDITIFDCPDDTTRPAYIDLLRAYADPASAAVPSGFQIYGDQGSEKCNLGNGDDLNLHGNWYVKCPTLRLGGTANMNFKSGNVILAGAVAMGGSSVLSFNSDVNGMTGPITPYNPATDLPVSCAEDTFSATSCYPSSSRDAAWVYQRSGGIKITSGRIVLEHASLVQAIKPGNIIETTGGRADWSSPDEGPLLGLSLWSETDSAAYSLAGGGGLNLEGVFFTPEADSFTLSGGSSLLPQRAQFISRRLTITGGAQLRLSPEGTKLIQIPPPAAYLIR
jgi:hypothetical protein